MAVWSPLITNWAVNLTDSAPRTARIDSIIGHHVAGTSETNALAQFAPGGRVVTTNVFIARKRIWGIVPEDRRAFTSGSAFDDDRALTFEALNESAGPGWSFHPDTLDSIARLQADWSSRYGIRLVHSMPGILEHRNLYEWFRRSYATACAGPSYNISQRIVDTAAFLSPKPDPAPVPEPTIGHLMAFRSIGIGYRPNEKEDRLITTGLDFESGQRVETIANKSYCTSWYAGLTEGGLKILTKGHYDNVLKEFDAAVAEKRAHELAVARAAAGK